MNLGSDPGPPQALQQSRDREPSPAWGLLGSAFWAVVAIGVQYAVVFVVTMAWGLSRPGGVESLSKIAPVSPIIWVATIAALPLQLLVLVWATRRRGGWVWYLALLRPRAGQFLSGLAIMAVLLATSDALTVALGRDLVPPFMADAYRAARAAGALPALVLAVAVAAPVWEEFLFRGFLYRGLSEARLGPAGAVVVTALAWAVLHIQYDWYGIVQIFVIGLVFGWLRMRTGSTLLTTVLHGMTNLVATIETFIEIEGWL